MRIKPESKVEVFLTALKLGLTSFGGPVAHIGYFRDEYVNRRKWISESSFADLVALCQFLPGPASSQLGMAIGIRRAGLGGALAAWLGFTLPSALVMILFALWVGAADLSSAGWLQGLKLVAVAVVAQAVWSMAVTLAPDRIRATMALFAAGWASLMPGPAGQLLPLLLCGAAAVLWLKPTAAAARAADDREHGLPFGRRLAAAALAVFAILLIVLPIAAKLMPSSPAVSIMDSSYRAGSLVFGGGHVVLPMLEKEVVHGGEHGISADRFMAGYGAAQAVPGPLFTFAAYIGASIGEGWHGIMLAAAALLAIFLPSFLLLVGALPFWQGLQHNQKARLALMGVNAAVVGILLAALYNPVWTSTVHTAHDFTIVLVAFLMLQIWKCQPWQVVLIAAAAGFIIL
ncbi:chromate efflux transporter [Paenibacillus abyssi]|uniref:Transporter n=1 Tax=Paenibacillus abyssi TaxID=1340531 RepID=A0A917FMI2_9BACL|nr:chromate efflux transporter [Paenibacillus abyssi]GGF89902.1 transporter [Paenibacillus abyssi]